MRVLLVTPAPPRSRKGNRVTAVRWARRIEELGHRVRIATRLIDQPFDLLVALHARKSAPSIAECRAHYPDRRIIVVLTGTDLYDDLPRSATARRSLELATRLVVLQPLAIKRLPGSLRGKAHVIIQSATPYTGSIDRRRRTFDVCVLGHLRRVKDPFRAAEAARQVPPESRLRVLHLGAALSPGYARRARREMARNPRYRWLGDVSHGRAMRLLAASRLLVLSSISEGGANVISEAVVNDVPILASRIDGSVGLLGSDYPGYFPVGDTESLARLLWRAESDPAFYRRLEIAVRARKPLFSPEHERGQWQQLLESATL